MFLKRFYLLWSDFGFDKKVENCKSVELIKAIIIDNIVAPREKTERRIAFYIEYALRARDNKADNRQTNSDDDGDSLTVVVDMIQAFDEAIHNWKIKSKLKLLLL